MLKLDDISLLIVTVPGKESEDLIGLEESYNSQIIDFYTTDLEEIATIAKHRILPTPTVLIFYKSKVIGRIVTEIPSKSKLKSIIKKMITKAGTP